MSSIASHNLLLDTDSYKTSHWLQYPPHTTALYHYMEARGSQIPGVEKVLLFGLQMALDAYLTQPLSAADIDEAQLVCQLHGIPFNRAGFERVIQRHGGLMPLEICAVPEGTRVPLHLPLVTVESTDPELFWLGSYLETLLLRAVWYGSAVATISRTAKEKIRAGLQRSCDDVEGQLLFRLHDFGARGVSSRESAAIGGAAHLVNFMGSDTLSGIMAARRYYGCTGEMPGFSIPAAEHSTITSWGATGEEAAYANMLRQFARPGSILAVVSDSYDIRHAVDQLWGGSLRQAVLDSGATLVIRPDSGDPVQVVNYCLNSLAERFGYTVNQKGYRVLQQVRLIQGDGINLESLQTLIDSIINAGYSLENVAFGMGGALLQKLNRDTFEMAMKCSAAQIDGQWRAVFKAPKDSAMKASKRGRISTYRDAHGAWHYAEREHAPADWQSQLRPVYRNGELLNRLSFDQVRANSELE